MNTTTPNRLIFLHIPKAGGSTLLDVLRRQYDRSDTFEIVTKFGQQAATRRKFEEMTPAKRNQIKLLMGHMDFGYHQLFDGGASYITMLRNPVGRVVSSYYYAKSHPNHYLHKLIKQKNLSLHDFILGNYTFQLENGMTKNLSGMRVEDQPCSTEMLAAAKQNIDKHFVAVGLLERYDESLLMYRRLLGWKELPTYFKKNITDERQPVEAITAETKALILERNWADVALYQYAKERFEAEWSREMAAYLADMQAFESALTTYRNKNQWKDTLEQWVRKTYKQILNTIRK